MSKSDKPGSGATRPVLVFAYGNPGRGDDALGPELLTAIETQGYAGVECQCDMQLQVEHVMDLAGRAAILFVDADVSCAEPFVFERLGPEKDGSYTSHAMTPGALLHAFDQVYGNDAPPAWMLRIRGYQFELGDPMGELAAANLAAAIELVKKLCSDHSGQYWLQQLTGPDDAQGNSAPSACRVAGCGGYTLPTMIEQTS